MTTRVNRLVLVVLLFSVVLIRLPLVTGQGGTVRLVVLLPFVAAAIWAVPRRSADVPLGLIALLALFITTVGIALVRGAQNGVFASPRAAWTDWLTLVVVASFAVLVLSTARTRSERESLLLGVAFAPAVYVAVNAVLWFERAHLPASLLSSTSAAEGKRAKRIVTTVEGLRGLSQIGGWEGVTVASDSPVEFAAAIEMAISGSTFSHVRDDALEGWSWRASANLLSPYLSGAESDPRGRAATRPR